MKQPKLKLKLFERDIKQHQLARHLDVTETIISQWINGTKDVPPEKQKQIAKILKCDVADIFQNGQAQK
ncbi:MAG: helix-turn-helix transcriptional regulator [Bdellovibrionota bacterium]